MPYINLNCSRMITLLYRITCDKRIACNSGRTRGAASWENEGIEIEQLQSTVNPSRLAEVFVRRERVEKLLIHSSVLACNESRLYPNNKAK